MKNQRSQSQIIIYRAETGEVKIDVRFDGETVWLTQKLLAKLFGVTIPTVNEHIKNIYKEGELKESSTIRKFLIVQKEGIREVERETDFYNVVIAKNYLNEQELLVLNNLVEQYLVFAQGQAMPEKFRTSSQRN